MDKRDLAEELADEAPPEVPDLDDEAPPDLTALLSEDFDAAEPPSIARRLSPPPKPRPRPADGMPPNGDESLPLAAPPPRPPPAPARRLDPSPPSRVVEATPNGQLEPAVAPKSATQPGDFPRPPPKPAHPPLAVSPEQDKSGIELAPVARAQPAPAAQGIKPVSIKPAAAPVELPSPPPKRAALRSAPQIPPQPAPLKREDSGAQARARAASQPPPGTNASAAANASATPPTAFGAQEPGSQVSARERSTDARESTATPATPSAPPEQRSSAPPATPSQPIRAMRIITLAPPAPGAQTRREGAQPAEVRSEPPRAAAPVIAAPPKPKRPEEPEPAIKEAGAPLELSDARAAAPLPAPPPKPRRPTDQAVAPTRVGSPVAAAEPPADKLASPLPPRPSPQETAAAPAPPRPAAEERVVEPAKPKSDEARPSFPRPPPPRRVATSPEAGEDGGEPRDPGRTQQLVGTMVLESTVLLEEEGPATLPEPVQPARPPPPPRRVPRPPIPDRPPEAKDVADENERKSLRRPWWEELFREDFVRAMPRPTPAQIKREVDFIEQSLGVAGGGIILDLGCGAGQHAVELSSRGYGVVGYDLSLYQLALAADAAEEAGQKLNFLQGDMRELAFDEMFDGIYCWNTSFGYFEEDKNLLVAQHMFRALRPGGMLLLDVVNRDFVVANQPSAVWYEGDACVCMDDMCVDFITSRLKVKRSVIFDDGRQRECYYSLRIYSLHELGKLLHEVGFRVAEATGHPSTPGVFFGLQSPRVVILAQRP